MAKPKKVLILQNPRDLSAARTHALDCRWVRGVKLDYVEADASMFPSSQPRCSYCGGGR